MAPNGSACRTEQAALCKRDGDIAEVHQLAGHLHGQRHDSHQGIHGSIDGTKLLRQIEQAAALRIDVASRSHEGADLFQHRRIFAELPGIKLGISPGEVERVQPCRQYRVGEGTKGDNLRALLAQQIQVVFVVKGKSTVPSHADAQGRWLTRRHRLCVRGWYSDIEWAVESQEGVDLKVLFRQTRQGVDLSLKAFCIEQGFDLRS